MNYDAPTPMMARPRSSLQRMFLNPVFLVGLTAFLAAFVVQSGELGSSDTTHRLQATHSFWTSSPEVYPDDYPEFGIHGRNGKLHGWYGIGQSLLMLPADIVGTYIERLPVFRGYEVDPTVCDIFVSYTTNILLCVLIALVSYRLLGFFVFSTNQRIAGVFALIFCTTCFYYTQIMMENNYILLLTLAGLTFQYQWLLTGDRRALMIGSLALGANLLTRLTTGMDLIAVFLFLAVLSWFSGARGTELRSRFSRYAKVVFPVYAIFALIDRLYQFYRFGSFFTTYMQVYAREAKLRDPGLPAAYPFETPFHVGFVGALFKPEKSIFLFDPLLVLTVILCAMAWRHFRPEIQAYLIAFAALLLAYISFYATYTVWSGDFAWGDRYVSTCAQLVGFISVPLLMRHRAEVGRLIWAIGIAILATSVLIQVSSLMFWCPLEIYQMDTLGHPTFVVALRMKNIFAFSLGKMDQWGLTNDSMSYDPWDYAHITAFNFLPFLVARIGKAASWAVHLIAVLWFAALAGLISLLVFIRSQVGANEFDVAATGSPSPAK